MNNQSRPFKKITVFCGSSMGINEAYANAAKLVAQNFVKNNITLVYGGGRLGLMGTIADEVLALGGEAIGVIPKSLVDIELAHQELSQLHIVSSMHERKQLMCELADGFILLPGGAGSLDEFFEILTWRQLGLHSLPYGILNVNGYFDSLFTFLNHTTNEGFFKHQHPILVDTCIDKLMGQFYDHIFHRHIIAISS